MPTAERESSSRLCVDNNDHNGDYRGGDQTDTDPEHHFAPTLPFRAEPIGDLASLLDLTQWRVPAMHRLGQPAQCVGRLPVYRFVAMHISIIYGNARASPAALARGQCFA